MEGSTGPRRNPLPRDLPESSVAGVLPDWRGLEEPIHLPLKRPPEHLPGPSAAPETNRVLSEASSHTPPRSPLDDPQTTTPPSPIMPRGIVESDARATARTALVTYPGGEAEALAQVVHRAQGGTNGTLAGHHEMLSVLIQMGVTPDLAATALLVTRAEKTDTPAFQSAVEYCVGT